jgi:biotin carboxyl carrier protein
MPGTVLQVRVENGQSVAAGDVLVILESMKMELAITAPVDGIVSGVTLSPGDRVELGQALVAILPADGVSDDQSKAIPEPEELSN